MSELEQKRGRGSPENNDNEVLTAILNNEDKRKEFVEAIENLGYHKRKSEADMLLHKEDRPVTKASPLLLNQVRIFRMVLSSSALITSVIFSTFLNFL